MAFACISKLQMWNENKSKRKNQPKNSIGDEQMLRVTYNEM